VPNVKTSGMELSYSLHITMHPERKPKNRPKYYPPDKTLSDYMHEKLQFEKQCIKDGVRGSDRTSHPDYNKLTKKKHDVLPKLFTSMANVYFFFDCIANVSSSAMPNIDKDEREARKVIRELFESDVKDLLGIRRTNSTRQIYAFLFDRLIHSLIYTGDGDVDKADDFRLKLIHILQDSIFRSTQVPLLADFSGKGWGIALNDIGRASAWTEMLAKKVDTKDDDSTKPDNTVDLSNVSFVNLPSDLKHKS
jgi:hypothetical protein